MKTSGAPEVGDLVIVKPGRHGNILTDNGPGIIVDCVGVQCEIQWPHCDQYAPSWFPRADLIVVGDINAAR